MRKNEMNLINIEKFKRDLESKFTAETSLEELIDITECARQTFIIDSNKWTKADKKKLMKEELSAGEIINLKLFFNTMEEDYATKLIVKDFIKYKDNIREIMAIRKVLKEVGIVRYEWGFDTYNTLARVIQYQKDWEDFLDLWERECKNHTYFYIVDRYLESKGFKVGDKRPTEEQERRMFRKNYDVVMERRKSKIICVQF
ncbi:hypothetical protein [Anaerovorax odorimutans]|uniref:hypothetical protein n=1 Tax=Anaerovorax odorimutans TaxID=109327 RepID=UPI0004195EE5|nr:hypothetical protein [Anaerovorax odorimutans]